ncbi:MAG: 2TM domain-containing protein [Anaerolineaceae bacterium]|nr:2TM domain-containing protein [Anaerolineaceae bacterium]
MSNAPLKRKRKNDEWYDWADGELPPPQAGWLVQLLGFSWWVIKAPFSWAWRQSLAALRWSWRQTVAALRWSWRTAGRVTRWSLRVTWAATVWTATAPFRGLRWLFGGKEPAPQNRYEEIRQRIRRHYRRRNRFITHLLLFILGNAMMWINAASLYYGYLNSAILRQTIGISIGWAIALLYHYLRVRMADAEDQALETALERERAWEQGQHFADEETPFSYGSRLAEEDTWEEWETPPAPMVKRKNR